MDDDQAGLEPALAAVGASVMRRAVILIALLGAFAVGCGSSEVTEQDAKKQKEIENRVNAEALQKTPPPAGDGPSN